MAADLLREILDLVEASHDEPELTGSELAGPACRPRFPFDRPTRSSASTVISRPGYRRRVTSPAA